MSWMNWNNELKQEDVIRKLTTIMNMDMDMEINYKTKNEENYMNTWEIMEKN